MTASNDLRLAVPSDGSHRQTSRLRHAFHRHDDFRMDYANDFPAKLGLLDVVSKADKSALQYLDGSHAGYEYIRNDIRFYEFHDDLPFPDCPFRLGGLVDQTVKSAMSGSAQFNVTNEYGEQSVAPVTPKAQVRQ